MKKLLPNDDAAEAGELVMAGSCLLPERPTGLALAVSGGLDSMVLMHELSAWGRQRAWPLCVLHVNYGLRGEESAADAAFVQQEAAARGLPCQVLDVSLMHSAPAAGIQVWARTIRHDWFQRFVAEGWVVALGHHEDDWAETILMRLARGTSVSGLLGLRPFQDGLWRPLLGVGRQALGEMATRKKIPHREDSSNAKLDYARNRVRRQVMTELAELYPGLARHMIAVAEEAENLRQYALQMARERAAQLGKSSLAPDFLVTLPEDVACHLLGEWWRGTALPQGDNFLNRSQLMRLWGYVQSLGSHSKKAYPVDDLWEIHQTGDRLVARYKGFGPRGPRFEQHRQGLERRTAVFTLSTGASLAWSPDDDMSTTIVIHYQGDGPNLRLELGVLGPRELLQVDERVSWTGLDVMQRMTGGLTNEIIKINVDNRFWGLFYQGELFSLDHSGQYRPQTDGKIAIGLLKDP